MFRQVFQFENPVKAQNGSGGFSEEFDVLYSARGYFRQLSGNRDFSTGQDLMVEAYEMFCYWRSALERNITKDTRVIYDNKIFRIDRIERWNENRQFYRLEISQAE